VVLTDPTARQVIVDQLTEHNIAYSNAKLTDDFRKSLLVNDAREMYAGRLNKTVESLTEAERADADAMAERIYRSTVGASGPASETRQGDGGILDRPAQTKPGEARKAAAKTAEPPKAESSKKQ
jgi:hypothetical protein